MTKTSVGVRNGVFTVQLDFGANAFSGANRWLETSARVAGAGAFALLLPRQPITSTPYAIRALSASTADGLSGACVACVQDSQINSVAGSKITGAIPIGSVPIGSRNYIQNSTVQQTGDFNITGDGTAGGTLTGNSINSITQYKIDGSIVLSVSGGPSGSIVPNTNTFTGIGAGPRRYPTALPILTPFSGMARVSLSFSHSTTPAHSGRTLQPGQCSPAEFSLRNGEPAELETIMSDNGAVLGD